MNFIEWCNNNEGFATILLSTLTLIVSIIAIVVSIKTSKLPYKKKININIVYNELDGNLYSCQLYIINTGNRTIGVTNVCLEYDNQLIYMSNNINAYIEPFKVEKHNFTFEQYKVEDGLKKAVIKILDVEQQEHVFKNQIAMG